MTGQPVYIIAEAGVNHNGRADTAAKMVKAAAAAGADAVKFQTFRAESLAAAGTAKAEYQKKTTDAGESALAMLKRLELPHEAHVTLQKKCAGLGIDFLSTPFDLESLRFLATLNMPYLKLSSGTVTDLPLLEAAGALKTRIILSTGLADLAEAGAALNVLTAAGTALDDIILLHANTAYPTRPEDANLRAIGTMAAAFGVKTGYSDHTPGITAPVAAVICGACLIEKHFTLDRSMEGPDHAASLEPRELTAMVTAVREASLMLGDGVKRRTPSEAVNLNAARKSIVAAVPIKKGDVFTAENLTVKRPGGGLSPMLWHTVLGLRAVRDFVPDEAVTPG